MHDASRIGWLIALLLFLSNSTSLAAGPVVSLGTLPGDDWSDVLAISGDGSTVVGRSGTAEGESGFVWTQADGLVDLGVGRFPAAVSEDGSIVAGHGRLGPTAPLEAWIWTREAGFITLGPLNPHQPAAAVGGISNDGTTVVGGILPMSPGGLKPSAWLPPDLAPVLVEPDPTVLGGMLLGASADGTVLVGNQDPSLSGRESRAFVWSAASGFTFLTTERSLGISINPGGDIAVGGVSSQPVPHPWEPYFWTPSGGLERLAVPQPLDPAWSTMATDLSADGATIVGMSIEIPSEPGNHPREDLVWPSDGSVHTLRAWLEARGVDLTGWSFEVTSGEGLGSHRPVISDDGEWIAASALPPGSNYAQAFVVHVPEPRVGLSAAGGVLALAALARRRVRQRAKASVKSLAPPLSSRGGSE